jgi:8-oxo-dGTP pyrophosphatase MutT (NUDIX family)
MIAASDAVFLRRLTQSLHARRMDVYRPGKRRSSAAIILRFGDTNTNDTTSRQEISKLFSKWDRGMGADDVIARLEQNVDVTNIQRPSDLRILFVKRAVFTSDRWGGQVALPGGGRDPEDADDKETLRREAYHELGVPLDSPDFVLLGRLEDFQPRSRGLTDYDEVSGAVQARFVYLHIGDLTPSVTLSRMEIEAVRWCPVNILLDPKSMDEARVVHHILHFVPMLSTDVGSMVRDLFPGSFIRFPSIAVEPNLPNWRIWGLPLRTVSEVLELFPTQDTVAKSLTKGIDCQTARSTLATPPSASDPPITDKRPALDWPRFSSNNFLVQFLLVDAYHGYLRLRSPEFAGQRLAEPFYLFVLMFDAMLMYSFLVVVMTLVSTVLAALLTALEVMEHEGWEKKKRAYYAENQPLTWGSANFYEQDAHVASAAAARAKKLPASADNQQPLVPHTQLAAKEAPGSLLFDGIRLEKQLLSSIQKDLELGKDDEAVLATGALVVASSSRSIPQPSAVEQPSLAVVPIESVVEAVVAEYHIPTDGMAIDTTTRSGSVDDVLARYRSQ